MRSLVFSIYVSIAMAPMHSVLLSIIVAICVAGVVAAPPKVLRASAEIRTHNVLGADVRLGLLQVDFDQPLHLTLSYGNCDNNTWADCRPDPPADCPPCDYTDAATCAGAYASRINCPCPILNRTCSLPILRFDEPFRIELQDADFYPMRAYIGPEHLRRAGGGCKIPFWTLYGETGDPDPYIYTAENYDAFPVAPTDGSNSDWHDGRPGSDWINICPKDPKFKFGTYIFAIKAYASDIGIGSKSTLTMKAVDLPAKNGPAITPTTCNNATGSRVTSLATYRGCLRDGVRERYTMTQSVLYYWTFPLPEKKCYPIYIESEVRVALWVREGDNATFPGAAILGAPPMFLGNGQQGFLMSGAFTFCSTGNSTLYLTHRHGFPTTDFSLYVTTAMDTKYYLPIDSPTISPLDLWILLQSSAYVNGPNGRTFQCNMNPTSDKRFRRNDCFLYWHLVPQEEASPFYPRPPYSILLTQWDNSELPKSAQQPVLATRYQAAVLLKHQLTPTSSIDGAGITDDQFFNLTMQFTGKFVNKDGEAVVDFIPKFERRDPSCEYSKAKPIFDKARSYMKRMEELNVGIELTNTRIAIDTYTFSASYQDCRDLLPELYLGYRTQNVTVKGSTACVTPTSAPEFATDPCCNPVISWNATGCIPRDVIVTRTVPMAANSSEAATANSLVSVDASRLTSCRTASCSRSIFADFAKADLRANDCAAATDNQDVFVRDLDRPFRKCRDQWMGVDQNVGIPCIHDSDCPSSFCNMLTKNCNYSVHDREDKFLQCMLDSVDVFLLNYIETELGIPARFTAGDQANFAGWKRVFTKSDCSNGGTFPLPLGLRTANRYDKGTISPPIPATYYGCYEPYWFCMEESCKMPYICDNFLTGAGGFPRTWNRFDVDAAACASAEQCNSMNCRTQEFSQVVSANIRRNCTQECLYVSNTTTLKPPQFCGACEDDFSCVDVSAQVPGSVDDQNSCTAAANVCFLANGTTVTGLTPAQCANTFSCSEKCWKNGAWANCDDETECLAVSGQCHNDQEAFKPDGSCALPMAPYRNPDCPAKQRAHEMGCIDYSLNASTCLTFDQARFYSPARNPTECINQYGYGCLEVYIPENKNQVGDTIVTLKPNRQICEAAGGQWVPRMPWKYGRWLSGTSRPLSWTTRSVRTGRFFMEPVLNWLTLYSNITTAAEYKYSFQTKTETICRYNALVNALDSIACDCASGNSSSACFAGVDNPATVGNSVVCPRGDTFIDASPGSLSFNTSSVEASNCVRIFPSLVSALQYENIQSSKLSSFLIDFSEKTRWSFRNSNNALIGQILSDGVSLRFETSLFTGSIKAFKYVRFCMGGRPDIEIQDRRYSVYDIAEVVNGTFRILQTEVSAFVSNEYPALYCGVINELKPEAQYFPVIRLADAATARRYIFNVGEVVQASFLTALYGFGCLFAGVLTFRLCNIRFHLVHNAVWVFGIISFLRMIYFALMAASSPAESGAADYILIELPSFLYFSALSFFVVSWVVLARTVVRKNLRRQGTLRFLMKIVIAVNAIIYLLWIVLIIVYETTKQNVVSPCGSRLGNQVDNTTRRAISLTYRIFVGIISLVIGLGFIIYGSIIVRGLIASAKSSRGGTKSALKPRSMLVFQLTFICSVGLIVQTIFLIILVATGFQNNVLTMSFLGFFELFPMLIIMAIFWKSTLVQNIPTQTAASSFVSRTNSVMSQVSDNTDSTNSKSKSK